MREQPGFGEDEFAHRRHVIERARESPPREKLLCFGEDALRLITQAEERLLASGAARRLCQRKHFFRGHEMRAGLARIFAEGAITAVIAAQRRERNEHFFREADDFALPSRADFACRMQQPAGRRPFGQHQSSFAIQAETLGRAIERLLHFPVRVFAR